MISDMEALTDGYDREPRPLKEDVWFQQDGTAIKIKDMTIRHIKNCINMLKNNYDHYDSGTKDVADKYLRRFKDELDRRELERHE